MDLAAFGVTTARPVADAVRGYKLAVVDMGARCFRSFQIEAAYGVDAEARCLRLVPTHAPHAAPRIGCSCGFYAHAALDQAFPDAVNTWTVNQPNMVIALLEVDLSGVIFKYACGYRAQHQRVMRVVCPTAMDPTLVTEALAVEAISLPAFTHEMEGA